MQEELGQILGHLDAADRSGDLCADLELFQPQAADGSSSQAGVFETIAVCWTLVPNM